MAIGYRDRRHTRGTKREGAVTEERGQWPLRWIFVDMSTYN